MASQPDLRLDFPQRLQIARIQRGMSQGELARALGVTSSAVANWELGTRTPRKGEVERLAEVLGVSPGWLFFGELPTADPTVDQIIAEVRALPTLEQRLEVLHIIREVARRARQEVTR